jgi:L-amino acid N-acyltransferase YncA
MNIRSLEPSDYNTVIPNLNNWWGGRQMADMLPKLFFVHFKETSFVIEKDNELIGFLSGFVSQTYDKEAYIHFVGVHPDYRQHGIGGQLYRLFFDTVKKKGCNTVRAVTSPVNKNSVAYHTKIGFEIQTGDKKVDGVDVHTDYDGKGQDRVLFFKKI